MLPENQGADGAVRLADLRVEDAPRMERWARDPVIADNVGIRGPVSLGATRAWIATALESPDCHPYSILADGHHVGNVVLDQIDDGLGTARLSVYVGEPEWRGRGIGRQAVALAVEDAFLLRDLSKIWLTVHVRNGAAIAVYARCGFVVEGVLRDEFLLEGERVDVLRMAVLRADGRPS